MKFLSRWRKTEELASGGEFDGLRAAPGQAVEGRSYLYAPDIDVARYIAVYAMNTWVYAAVARLAELAASAALRVVSRDDSATVWEEHGLAGLVGKYGKPNDDQDPIEFLEKHFTYYELAGNVFWYWENDASFAGPPTAVHLLDPAAIRIRPGRDRKVAYYEYWVMGERYRIEPEFVTHFRKPNPFNAYWGLPALQALMTAILGDRAAAEWNRDFFGDDVAVPAGVWVIPSGVSDKERDRFDREVNAKHGERRKTAVLRADAGATVYHPAGLGPHDADFRDGRLLNRQEIYECLGLPLGLMSEASTEAHARVAERQYMAAVQQRHIRTASKLNADALGFWPRSKQRAVMFEDVTLRAADWDQLMKKYTTLQRFVDPDVIVRELGYKPEEARQDAGIPALGWPTASGRDSGSVPGSGQETNVVGREK